MFELFVRTQGCDKVPPFMKHDCILSLLLYRVHAQKQQRNRTALQTKDLNKKKSKRIANVLVLEAKILWKVRRTFVKRDATESRQPHK